MNLDRYYGESLKPTRLSKSPKLLSKKHLEWVRRQRCVITGNSGGEGFHHIDAHHMLKRSQGENDFTCLPLRHDKHMEYHQIGHEAFESKYAVDLNHALIAKLIERIWELERRNHA